MSLMKYLRLLAAMAVVASVAPVAVAQFDQTINVEGKYVPEYIDHEPMGIFPVPLRLTVADAGLEYDTRGVTVAFRPDAIPIEATGWRTERSCTGRRGYVGLGLGSWLNASAEAGYRFLDSSQGVAGIRLGHTSTSLWKPALQGAPQNARQWRYDERLGAYYSGHPGDSRGMLEGDINVHLGWFDYYGYAPVTRYARAGDVGMPEQSLTDISARIGWNSPTDGTVRWNINAGYRYFGFGKSYLPDGRTGYLRENGEGENRMTLGARLAYAFGSGSVVDLCLEGNAFLFSGGKENFLPLPSNYGNITLTPAYTWQSKSFRLRAGAHLDFTCNGRYGQFAASHSEDSDGFSSGSRFSTFHVSPDVSIDYTSGPLALYLHLTGGIGLTTLAGNYERDYYTSPFLPATAPVYTPVDGRLGLRIGPVAGFEIGLEAGCKVSRNVPLGGFYTLTLNDAALYSGGYLSGGLQRGFYTNLSGWSAGAHLGYEASPWFSIKADAAYQPQNSRTGYFNGYDRPRWIAGIHAESNPWERLTLEIGYDYRGVRRVYLPVEAAGGVVTKDMSLPDLTMLNASIGYGITEDFRIWVRGDNLLNRHDVILPSLPSQGLAITAGFSLQF